MAMTTTVAKILVKATELEAQAKALRVAAAVLDEGILDDKRAATGKTVEQAIAVRQAQRNGHALPTVPRKGKKKKQRDLAARDAKRDAILAILRDHGKAMSVAQLKEAAAAQGITALNGVASYARAGYLLASGKPGRRRFTFRQMPEPAV